VYIPTISLPILFKKYITVIDNNKLKNRKRAKRGKIKTLKIKYSITFVCIASKKILYTY
jgi:hypothetical protein